MDLYPIALFVHIVGVLGLFMAIAVEVVGVVRLRRAQTVEQVCEIVEANAFLANVFPVVTITILFAGLYMVVTRWGWSNAWVDVSLSVFVLLSVQGVAVNARYMRQILSQAQSSSHGPVPPELSARISSPVLWTSELSMAALALGIVYMMTLKPDLTGSLLTVVITLTLGVAAGQLASRSTTAPALADALKVKQN